MSQLQLDPEWVRRINRAARMIESLNGPLVKRVGDAITIGPAPSSRFRAAGGSTTIPTGQYTGMVLEMVAAQQIGFGYVIAINTV